MKKTPGMLVVGLALIVGGCTSTKSATRVSFAEPASTYSSSDRYAETGYARPAYNPGASASDDATVTTTYVSPTLYANDQPLTARTVNMPGSVSRRYISLDDFRRHLTEQRAVIVDVREPRDFRMGHVRGAVNIPAGEEDAYRVRLQGVAFDEPIIVYCGSSDCSADDEVANWLISQGYTIVHVFNPGWDQLSRTDLVP